MNREPGWYWVKWFPNTGEQEPAYWDGESFDSLSGYGVDPYKVGPRIEPPIVKEGVE